MLHLHKILDCPVTSWGSCLSFYQKILPRYVFLTLRLPGFPPKSLSAISSVLPLWNKIPLYFINGLPMITTAKRKFFFPFARI